MTSHEGVTWARSANFTPASDRQADILQVAPDLAVTNVDDADRRLANLPHQTGVGPLADDDHRVAFRHKPLDLKRHVRRARHGLAAQQDEGVPAEDRLGYTGCSVHHV